MAAAGVTALCRPFGQRQVGQACSSAWCQQSRCQVTLSQVSSASIPTKKHLDAFQPKYLRNIKVFQTVPPADLPKHMHGKLDKAHSNPRTILR